MEIYGYSGYIIAVNNNDIRIRRNAMESETSEKITSADIAVYEYPFTYFADVIHKKITMPEYGLYSLKNN